MMVLDSFLARFCPKIARLILAANRVTRIFFFWRIFGIIFFAVRSAATLRHRDTATLPLSSNAVRTDHLLLAFLQRSNAVIITGFIVIVHVVNDAGAPITMTLSSTD